VLPIFRQALQPCKVFSIALRNGVPRNKPIEQASERARLLILVYSRSREPSAAA